MHYSKLFMVVRVDVILSHDIILHAKDIEEHAPQYADQVRLLNQRGLTLNKEKCTFKMPQLQFMENLLSTHGIGPIESKVEAVVKAREPETTAEVGSFMGLVNFSASLSRIWQPLLKYSVV